MIYIILNYKLEDVNYMTCFAEYFMKNRRLRIKNYNNQWKI